MDLKAVFSPCSKKCRKNARNIKKAIRIAEFIHFRCQFCWNIWKI